MPSPVDDPGTFADLLAHHRAAAGHSQQQLAAVASLSVRAIRDLERGAVRRPQHASVIALADALDLAGAARDAFVAAARQTPPRSGLPAPSTALIGRDGDIDGVAALLRQPMTRLVSVTGCAGVGTSAVARHAVRRVAERFDEVCVLELSRVADPAEVGPALAATLDPVRPDTRTLVLLDGFRHGDAAALAVAGLLTRHRRLHALVSARSPLKLRGEHIWPLAPLPVDAGTALLAERAAAVRAGFTVHAGNERAVASVCRRLAGVPRAIELAALRLRTRDPEELDAELARELAATSGPNEVVPAMLAAAVAALPAREARTLAAVAAASTGVRPAELRRRLVRADLTGAEVDVAVSTLATLGLITVHERAGQVRLAVVEPVRGLLGSRHG